MNQEIEMRMKEIKKEISQQFSDNLNNFAIRMVEIQKQMNHVSADLAQQFSDRCVHEIMPMMLDNQNHLKEMDATGASMMPKEDHYEGSSDEDQKFHGESPIEEFKMNFNEMIEHEADPQQISAMLQDFKQHRNIKEEDIVEFVMQKAADEGHEDDARQLLEKAGFFKV